MTIVGLYFFTSLFIFMISGYNILVPCLFKTTFHIECYGCGLTSAFIELLHLDFATAYHENPFIYIVLPILGFVVWKDFRKFYHSYQSEFRNK